MMRRILNLNTVQKGLRALNRTTYNTTANSDVQHVGKHTSTSFKQGDFGILFDIDGVLARGYVALPEAREAFQFLQDSSGKVKVPVAFVTNALSLNEYKAGQLTEWLGAKVRGSQMVMAAGPLEVLTELHHKHCLLVGQGPLKDITQQLGFRKVSTMEEVTEAYPLLDVADHEKRFTVATSQAIETDFPHIEVILLLGEPRHWETPLQLLIDLLLTHGKPSHSGKRAPRQTLPVVACNLDLQYMHRAAYPRYGHGAFLHCLESLFKKLTGEELRYKYLVGKPSEITFRFSEHLISREAQLMGLNRPLKRLYMVGDNQEVDIYGANLYQQYISLCQSRTLDGLCLPVSRVMPPSADLLPHTLESIFSVLVRTGVYKGEESQPVNQKQDSNCHSHRDFSINIDLLKPSHTADTVLEAVLWILEQEKQFTS